MLPRKALKPLRLISALLFAFVAISPVEVQAAFGLTTTADYYQVDTGAGLVFKVRRVEEAGANVNTVSIGDIRSLVYNGVEYQDQGRGSQINSGFDYLGYPTSATTVSAAIIGRDYIKITVTTDHLIHYYIAKSGDPIIYMATWFDVQPVTGGSLCRYIVRMPYNNLPSGPEPADINGTTYTVESGDIFGFDDGITRSKHYSNHRMIDWNYVGATGNGVGVFLARDSQEGGSGGPFYRSLIDQGSGDQELTYCINYGQTQTDIFRSNILNGLYALVFTDGQPPAPIDYSWVDSAGLNLTHWVPASGRGTVSGTVSGLPDGFDNVIGFANAQAQYWTRVAADGSYVSPPMIPGTYTATIYKQEMEVASDSVSVSAGNSSTLDIASSEPNPAIVWRLGDRDGTPNGFMNADKATWMHPSDVRMSDWNLGAFTVGSSTPETGIPCYQWKDVGGGVQAIQFNLADGQIVDTTVNVGITVAYSGARPNIGINGTWDSAVQAISPQPGTRSLTTGSYRGNNWTYTFVVPASELNVGINTLYLYPVSGSGGTGFLSPGYSLDYVEWQGTPAALPAAPSGISTATGDTQIDLDWDPIPSAMHYVVKRAPTADGPYTTLSDNVEPAHFSDTAATNGTIWFYRISAVNALGEGGYADVAATASKLVTLLKFDETSGTTAADSSDGNDGTLMSGASWTSGTYSNAVQLDGTANGYVELPDGLVEDLTDCTIATWVSATATPTWSRIFDFGMNPDSYMMLTPNSDAGTIRFAITTASNGGEQALNDSSPLPLNGWHHVAVTLSNDVGKLYVDGSVVDTQTITIDPKDLGLTRQDYIGKSQWPDLYPTAKIDDFRIYSRALSSSEISAMASQTPPPAPASLTGSATTNEVALSWSASSGAETYNIMRATTPGGPYALIAGGITGTSYTYLSAQSGVYNYVVTAENLAGTSPPSPEAELLVVKNPDQPVTPAIPVAYYRFENGTAGNDASVGATIPDSSGHGQTFNVFSTGVAPTYDSNVPAGTIPQTGAANALSVTFDGSDDLYGTITGMGGGAGFDFTVEAYVQFSGLAGFQTVVGRDDFGNEAPGAEALFYLQKTDRNALRAYMFDNTATLRQASTSAGAINTGTWYHIAAVGDATAGTLKLYLNGNLVGTSPDTYTGMFASSQQWTIGRGFYNGVADHVVGRIDEVRFCNTALTPEQFLYISKDIPDDSDADGLSDVFETYYFGNLGQTGTDDPDGDGDNNSTEQANGTPPTISSIPPYMDIEITNGMLNLGWPSNNTGWRLLYSTNLMTNTWMELPGFDTTNSYSTPATGLPDQVYFRLVYP